MKRQRSGKGTLSIETLGLEKILGDNESREILNTVKIKAADWVILTDSENMGFTRALNDFAYRYLAKKMELNSDPKQRKEFQNMRSQLEKYMKAASNLKHSGSPPPYPPKSWYDETMKFYDDLGAQFKERSSGGRKQIIAEWEFICQCAALFSVAFGIEPTSTPPGSRPETGAFTKFLKAIDMACRARLIDPGTAAFLLPERLHMEVFLVNQSDDRRRKLIERALAYRKPSLDNGMQITEAQEYWIGYKRFVEDMYIDIES